MTSSWNVRLSSIFVGTILALLLVWEFSVCTPAGRPQLFELAPIMSRASCTGTTLTLYSKPSEVIRVALETDLLRVKLWSHSLLTFVNSAAALLLTVAIALIWYYFACAWPIVRRFGIVFSWLTQVIPYVAIAWIISVVFRPYDKIVFGYIVASFPMFGALLGALKSLPNREAEVMTLFGASHHYRFTHLFGPHAAVAFFTGLTLAAPLSVVGVLIADLRGGDFAGLGQDILIASRNVRAAELWLATALAIAVSCGLTIVAIGTENAFARYFIWYRGEFTNDKR